MAKRIAIRQCIYSKVSNVEHGGLRFYMWVPIFVNVLLADTSEVAYCEPDRISPLLVCPVPCTSLLDPPRARFWHKLLVNARVNWAPARTLCVFARIMSKISKWRASDDIRVSQDCTTAFEDTSFFFYWYRRGVLACSRSGRWPREGFGCGGGQCG